MTTAKAEDSAASNSWTASAMLFVQHTTLYVCTSIAEFVKT